MRFCRPIAAALFLARGALAQPLIIEGEVPEEGPDHFFVPFDIPEGVTEIEIRHDDLSDENILDWGLNDPSGGFRGWGGGNPEPAIVGVRAASRSYVAGPLPAGRWSVVVGKAKVTALPARYRIEVDLRTTPSLGEQNDRRPYVDPGILVSERRWYAGDFHVHSLESGDAQPSLDAIAELAKSRGLDFVVISDHNTLTQLEFLSAAQERHRELLFVPAMEFTTYAGHANALGVTAWVDHKIGQPGVTIDAAARAFAGQGALFSINHPTLDVGDLCIGCAWKHELRAELIHAVEVATGGYSQSGRFFGLAAIQFWEELCATGRHVAAIGGSDDHRAGVDLSPLQSPIGDPTTLVFSDVLSVGGVLEAVRASRSVVKLQGPDDPMLEILSEPPRRSDTVFARSAVFTARASGALGHTVRWIRNGEVALEKVADSGAFELELEAHAPSTGEDRYRAEIWVEGAPRVLTSYVWVRAPERDAGAGDASVSDGGTGRRPRPSGGCSCDVAGLAPRGVREASLVFLALALSRRRTSGRGKGHSFAGSC